MFEIGDYVIFNNEIVRILEVKGQNSYKISGKCTSFNGSELSVIETTLDNHISLCSILEKDFFENNNMDYWYLLKLRPQGDVWIDDELNVIISSYQEFKDYCKKKRIADSKT